MPSIPTNRSASSSASAPAARPTFPLLEETYEQTARISREFGLQL